MVAGATGIDLFLMTIAADDGVMPQTREHAAVLEALGVRTGVVAVTKSDLADPDLALIEASELFPASEAVAVSARTGQGIEDLRAALDRASAAVASRADATDSPARLHVDRVFTIRGRRHGRDRHAVVGRDRARRRARGPPGGAAGRASAASRCTTRRSIARRRASAWP